MYFYSLVFFPFQPRPEAVRTGCDPSAPNPERGWMISTSTLKSSPTLSPSSQKAEVSAWIHLSVWACRWHHWSLRWRTGIPNWFTKAALSRRAKWNHSCLTCLYTKRPWKIKKKKSINQFVYQGNLATESTWKRLVGSVNKQVELQIVASTDFKFWGIDFC